MKCDVCGLEITDEHCFTQTARNGVLVAYHSGRDCCTVDRLLGRLEPEQPSENAVLEDLLDGIRELWQRKGADYTRGSEDRLANFRRNAESLGLDMRQVWAVYASKHWDAIMTWVKNGQVESEHIEGRLYDIATYALLGILIAREQNK